MKPPKPPTLATATLAAYLATDYRVWLGERSITLRIGEQNPELLRFLADQGAQTGLFITACNPWGELHTDDANRFRQQALLAELAQAGYTTFPGEGAGSTGDWPAEPSVFVLDPAPNDALRLCSRFRQNAVVVVGSNGVPALLLHPDLQVEGGDDPRPPATDDRQ